MDPDHVENALREMQERVDKLDKMPRPEEGIVAMNGRQPSNAGESSSASANGVSTWQPCPMGMLTPTQPSILVG